MRVKMRVKNIPAGLELHRARRSIGKPCSAPICKLVRRFVAGQSGVFHSVNVRNAAVKGYLLFKNFSLPPALFVPQSPNILYAGK